MRPRIVPPLRAIALPTCGDPNGSQTDPGSPRGRDVREAQLRTEIGTRPKRRQTGGSACRIWLPVQPGGFQASRFAVYCETRDQGFRSVPRPSRQPGLHRVVGNESQERRKPMHAREPVPFSGRLAGCRVATPLRGRLTFESVKRRSLVGGFSRPLVPRSFVPFRWVGYSGCISMAFSGPGVFSFPAVERPRTMEAGETDVDYRRTTVECMACSCAWPPCPSWLSA